MTIVKRGKTLRFELSDEGTKRSSADTRIRVPIEVLDMVDSVRAATGLSQARVLTEMIAYAYEHTEIVAPEEEGAE